MKKKWHVILAVRSGRQRACVRYTTRADIYRMIRQGRAIESRGYTNAWEAIVTALIYDYQWAAWLYYKFYGM